MTKPPATATPIKAAVPDSAPRPKLSGIDRQRVGNLRALMQSARNAVDAITAGDSEECDIMMGILISQLELATKLDVLAARNDGPVSATPAVSDDL